MNRGVSVLEIFDIFKHFQIYCLNEQEINLLYGHVIALVEGSCNQWTFGLWSE